MVSGPGEGARHQISLYMRLWGALEGRRLSPPCFTSLWRSQGFHALTTFCWFPHCCVLKWWTADTITKVNCGSRKVWCCLKWWSQTVTQRPSSTGYVQAALISLNLFSKKKKKIINKDHLGNWPIYDLFRLAWLPSWNWYPSLATTVFSQGKNNIVYNIHFHFTCWKTHHKVPFPISRGSHTTGKARNVKILIPLFA